MIFSKKAIYGLTALLILSIHSGDEYLGSAQIAEEGEIPAKFLESILVSLSKADLVEGRKGPAGGYKLRKTVDQISLYEVLIALESDSLNKKLQTTEKKTKATIAEGYLNNLASNWIESMNNIPVSAWIHHFKITTEDNMYYI